MNLKRLLKQTLLVAALLGVGTSAAWADSTVGSDQNTDDFWTVFSDYYTIQPNQTLTLNFTNHAGAANYNSWLIALSTDADRGASGYSEYVVLRNDAYGWQSGTYTNTVGEVTYVYNKTTAAEAEPEITDGVTTTNGNTHNWYTSLTSSFEWENFPTLMDGSTVTLTVKREWAKVTVRADITGSDNNAYWEEFVMNCGLGGLPIRAFLSVDHSHITGLTSSVAATTGIEESTAVFERGTTVRPWIETDLAAWTISGSEGSVTIDADKGLYVVANKNSGHTVTYGVSNTSQINPNANSILTIDAVWNNGTAYGNNNYNYLKIGSDITIRCNGQGQVGYVDLGEESFSITNACQKNYKRDNDIWTIHMEINTFTNEVLSLTLEGLEVKYGNTTKQANISLSNKTLPNTATYNSISTGNIQPTKGYMQDNGLISIKITERSTATVTTEFVDENGNKLKADVVEEKNIGESFTPTYDATIDTEFKKYTYASGGDAATVTDDVTCTVVYNTAWQSKYADYTIHVAEDYDIATSSVSNWTTSTAGRYTPKIGESEGNQYMTVNQGQRNNNGCTLTGTLLNGSVAAGNDFTLTFDLQLTAAKDRENTDISVFTINNAANSAAMLELRASATGSTTWKINGNAEQTVTMSTGTWYTVKMVRIDASTYLTISKKSDSSIAFAEATIASSETGGLGKMTFVTCRYNANIAMDNVLVRDVALGDLTAGTPTITTADGKTYFATTQTVTLACETDGASIYYTTDGTNPTSNSTLYSAPFEIDATTTVKAIAIKGYGVSDVASATISKLYEQTNVTGAETWDWSVITAASTQMTDATTPKKNDYFVLKNLELYDDYSIPAGFGDAQKLNVRGEYGFRIVNSTKFFQGANIKFTTEVPGTLAIDFSNTGDNGDRYLTVNGENTIYKSGSTSKVSATSIPVTAGEVVIGSSTNYLRFYKITFTPVTAVSQTITSAGWATLYTPYALDFSGVEGLEVYTAACENNKVTLTKVSDVPANSGVVLKGAANNYSIPVIASSTTDKGELTGSATAATAWNAYDGYNLYMLALNANSEAQFTKVTSGSIVAGKAFLKLSNTASRSLTVTFADETTGVHELKDSSVEGLKTGDCYNLKGQRVSQPTKGLYIVNGKKVVINK